MINFHQHFLHLLPDLTTKVSINITECKKEQHKISYQVSHIKLSVLSSTERTYVNSSNLISIHYLCDKNVLFYCFHYIQPQKTVSYQCSVEFCGVSVLLKKLQNSFKALLPENKAGMIRYNMMA